MASLDAVLQRGITSQAYDMQIADNGDILTQDFFDTAILYSLFGERRASADEIVEPQNRRGWIGNSDISGIFFENGSKLWLLTQARLTRDNLNRIQDEAQKSLQWLVDDGLAVSIDEAITTVATTGVVVLQITIRRSRDKVVRRFFELWENTGR